MHAVTGGGCATDSQLVPAPKLAPHSHSGETDEKSILQRSASTNEESVRTCRAHEDVQEIESAKVLINESLGKERRLFLVLPTRAHLDQVKSLMKGDLYIGQAANREGSSRVSSLSLTR